MPNTVKLHRIFKTKAEKIFSAFLDPDAIVKWLPPNGFTAKVHEMNVKVGGKFRISFTNFTTKDQISFGGEYLEIKPFELIRYTDNFEDPNLAGEIQVTINLKESLIGTEVSITQTGIPEIIPIEACYLGWQESLILLAKLVEPEINN